MYDFDENQSFSNYENSDMNLEYSHEPMTKGVSKDVDIEDSDGKILSL